MSEDQVKSSQRHGSDVHQQLLHWARKFGVTKGELQAAEKKVADATDSVEEYFARSAGSDSR